MIYYLVQGEAYQYLDRMAEMADSGAEVIFLTWDKPVEGALFLPNSTCMQGRNFLLDHVLKNNYKFEYLVFIDGDSKPLKGSWKEFNNFLLRKKPQICVPLTLVSRNHYFQLLLRKLHLSFLMPTQQRAIILDEQVLAFRKDIIIYIGTYIYPELFDTSCWWYNCEITQRILRYLIPYNIVQFNALSIENNGHNDYPRKYDALFIRSYLKNLGLYSIFPFFLFNLKNNPNIFVCGAIHAFNAFVELLFWIPFPIKKFNVAMRSEYVKQCLQKMKKPIEETTKHQQSCKSI